MGEYHGGKVWVEPKYSNILFAIDGEVYDFCGHACLVIGGAYSVDKHYRLARGWDIDVVLSHTCPLRYEPVEVFLPMVDQSTVDSSTEEWLGTIEQRLSYKHWYCGHFHTEKKIDTLRFIFQDYTLMPWHE